MYKTCAYTNSFPTVKKYNIIAYVGGNAHNYDIVRYKSRGDGLACKTLA